MDENRPRGREKNVTGQGKDIYKRGDELGTGPLGSQNGHSGRTEANGSGSGKRASGGMNPLMIIVAIAVLVLGGGGVGLSGLLGGGSSSQVTNAPSSSSGYTQPSAGASQSSGSAQSILGGGMSSALSSMLGSYGSVSSGWAEGSNCGRLNETVATNARAKRTNILGNGRDTVTIMVYMCGTDLESKHGMGTADLQEMAAASLSDKVNLIVFTGGCSQWQNNVVSSRVNQIYKIENGGLRLLEKDAGTSPMTLSSNLTSFIKYCAKNFPANRNELIFWDHGGGSLSGYGYDEKNKTAGSMELAGIDKALSDAGVKFDFIGFDACLMATLENALMLTKYADYMIASEETEPGVGWYYTNWLNELSKNTSMPTLSIGKRIVDDFVDVCAQKCRGQDTTLSVVDLSELEATVPETFKGFAVDTAGMVQGSEYKKVSKARGSTREFAASNKIDQVDLVHLASNLGTDESKALADSLLSAVKYNRTSSTVSNAYGLSIYFPYQKTSKVKAATAAYNAIGMDDEYTRCIQQFASMGSAGQGVSSSVSSYASNPLGALLGGSGSSSGSSIGSSDMVSQILMGVLSSTLTGGRSMDADRAAQYLTDNQFDSSQLVWTGDTPQISLSEEQWSLVNDIALSVFYDDGTGYIDLGLDNTFDFTENGALKGEYDGTWLAIDSQPVPYYHLMDVYEGDSYYISGYVPCFVNGERGELLLMFDNANPYGYIAGWRSFYIDGETETVAKNVYELNDGDKIDFACDFYGYDGTYQGSYLFGDEWIYHEDAKISNVYIDAVNANATYRFTDIYGQNYWTPVIP
ncbi:MAG: peptidase C11 [Oscillospiraceae bacterium]|nr:peptidase C11 [Oscillospiraceae bacterium]